MNGIFFMKRSSLVVHFLLVALLLSPFMTRSQPSRQTIIFHNLDKKEGKIYIAWYNKEEDFTKEDKIYLAKAVGVKNTNTVAVVFENVIPGTYAIAAFFDQNGNGKMDTNFFGIPKEKYGFSNNVRPMMRAATFKEASFLVTNNENTISIKLK